MGCMRPLLLAVLFASACVPPDPLVGTYNATVTGTDMQTAPNNASTTVSGTGTLAVTQTKADPMKYQVTFGQSTYQCTVSGTRNAMNQLLIDLAGAQQCHIDFSGGNFTATTNMGTVTVDKETMNTATMTLSYAYSGTGLFNINYAGTGTRTFTGTKL